jgi:hypothetical protein
MLPGEQERNDWRHAVNDWYRKHGLQTPRDHDTPSVPDILGPNYTPSETADILDVFEKTMQLSSQVRQKLGPLQLQSLQPRVTLGRRAKQRLTAADICFLRDMKVGL